MRRSLPLVLVLGLLACGPGRQSAADGAETSSESTAASTESGVLETESDSETDTSSEETETSSEESETETGNEEDVCELGCEGAVEVAEGIVRCPDNRVNRIGGGTFDPTITAPSCVGNEDILDCTSDAQCSDGMNGRCIQDTTYLEGDSGDGDGDPGTICRCAYSCSSDADCEQGSICVPPAVSYSDWPICIPAECQIGSECGECGECGMAASLQHVSCAGPVYAVECRTADDLCTGGCKLGTCFPAPNGQWQCHYIRQCF
jgi:hypothetical protein